MRVRALQHVGENVHSDETIAYVSAQFQHGFERRVRDELCRMAILLLGGTGKTARRIAPRLRLAGATVRTAARSNADVRFDWDDPTTHDAALEGIDAVYLVPPSLRLDHAPLVIAFLDRAQAAGVTHVTALSARGVELRPAGGRACARSSSTCSPAPA